MVFQVIKCFQILVIKLKCVYILVPQVKICQNFRFTKVNLVFQVKKIATPLVLSWKLGFSQ